MSIDDNANKNKMRRPCRKKIIKSERKKNWLRTKFMYFQYLLID